MTRALVIAAILWSLMNMSRAFGDDPMTASGNALPPRDLLIACESTEAAEHAFCLGYIRGAVEAYASAPANDYCMPAATSTADLVAIAIRWIHAHPELPTIVSIAMAARSAFPCR
jgi:Ssp1 endopeptidase immunity protein Rap1a